MSPDSVLHILNADILDLDYIGPKSLAFQNQIDYS